ncbi:MAG: V-type ATPase subunit [Trueperaceae bacterium]|nr:V-type ATPase subunit [Trueperaceae bacterium]
MAADFGYVNARVRGLRSRLLPEGFLGEQVDAEGFAALSNALAQSPYARELEEARGEHGPLAAVDAALARSFVRVTRLLLDASKGAAHELIALLLRRYDLANLKAIVRGLHAGRAADETTVAVLPAGSLNASVLRAMAGAEDVGAAGQVLAIARHPLAEAFRQAAAAYRDDGDLLRFEVALDRAFYASWTADAERLPAPAGFRRWARAEIDATNLRTALKLRGRPESAAEYFLAGGRDLTAATYARVAGLPRGEPLPQLTGFLAPVSGAADAAEAEARLVAALDAMLRRLSLDPLDVGLVADYLRRKERETAQLRLLARGKYYGVPRAALAKELGDA